MQVNLNMAFRSPPELLLRFAINSRPIVGVVSSACANSTKAPSSGNTYRAAVCTKLNHPLEIKHLARPILEKGQVRIDIQNAAVNFGDILKLSGKYQELLEPPFIPGVEYAGKVLEIADGVDNIRVGDRVIGMLANGFAEEVVTAKENVIALSDKVPFDVGASFLISYGSAWMALVRSAKFKPGDVVLVTAAAGALGLAAVDIAANVLKARVIGACGGPEKCALVKKYGAEAAIDYNEESLRDRVKELTNGKGADIIVDAVGGKVFNECVRSIAFEGRLVTMGYASGDIPKVGANMMLVKNFSLSGVFWGSYRWRHPAAFMESVTNVMKAADDGKIKPYISQTFPLSKVNEALEFIMSRKSTGKVLLDCKS